MTPDGLELLADQLDDVSHYAVFVARHAWARAFRRAARRARRLAAEERLPGSARLRREAEVLAGFENFGQYCHEPSEPRSAWLGSPNSLKTGVVSDGPAS